MLNLKSYFSVVRIVNPLDKERHKTDLAYLGTDRDEGFMYWLVADDLSSFKAAFKKLESMASEMNVSSESVYNDYFYIDHVQYAIESNGWLKNNII